MSGSETEHQDGKIPPARNEDEMNQIPALEVGDTVRVETRGDYAPDRTLTVTEEGTDVNARCLWNNPDNEGYVLEGYGTEYHLTTSGTRHWRRVDIVFKSRPEGQIVSNIEIIDRSADAGADE